MILIYNMEVVMLIKATASYNHGSIFQIYFEKFLKTPPQQCFLINFERGVRRRFKNNRKWQLKIEENGKTQMELMTNSYIFIKIIVGSSILYWV